MKLYTLQLCKIALAFFLILCLPYHSSAQGSWVWGRGAHGQGGEGLSPAVDAWGNVYALGMVTGPDTFGTIALPGAPMTVDAVVAKYDALGNVIWANRTQGGTGKPIVIAADNSGALYLLGDYSGPTLTLGSFTLTNPSTTSSSFFLAKFTPSGVVAWAKNFGSTGYWLSAWSAAIAVCNNHVYVTEAFRDPVWTLGAYTFTNSDPTGISTDIMIAKLDSNGNIGWMKQIGGINGEAATGLAVSPSEDVYLAGRSYSPTLMIGTSTLTPSLPGGSYFITKYDSSGNPIWAVNSVGTGYISAFLTIAADKIGNVAIAGTLAASTSLTLGATTLSNPAHYDNGFVAKYTANGIPVWAKAIKGVSTWCSGVATDFCDNIWVVTSMGTTNDTIDGHVLAPPVGFPEPAMIDLFDSAGNFITYEMSQTGGDDQIGIGCDGKGDVYIAGDTYYGGPFIFGRDSVYNRYGGENVFAAKFHYAAAIPDTTFRSSDSCITDSLLLTAPPGYAAYRWSDGNMQPSRKVYSSGILWVYCTGKCGDGVLVDTFKIAPGSVDTVYKRTDTTICLNASLLLSAASGYSSYLWSTGASGPAITVYKPGTYWVLARGNCTTPSLIDTFKVIQNNTNLTFSLGRDTTCCGPLQLTIPQTDVACRWQDGSTTSTFTADHSGTYWATITKNGCSNTDTINVNIPDLSQSLHDTIVCRDNGIMLSLSANAPAGSTVRWSTGSTKTTISIRDTGSYWVSVIDTPCAATDSFKIAAEYCNCELFFPNAFTPNGDGKNDFFYPILPQDCHVHDYMLAIYNRWGQRVFYTNDIEDRWDGMYLGVSAELGVYMYYAKYTSGLQYKKHFEKGDVTLVR